MYGLDVSHPVTFRDLMGLFDEYAHPVRDMWTSFWLKAAAVRDGETWHLCYFALVGRWREADNAQEVRELGDSLVAVSRRLDADEAWEVLAALVTDGTVGLADGVRAQAPDRQVNSTSPQAQVPTPTYLAHTIADVAEKAQWRWLYEYGWTQWLDDLPASELHRRVLPDLERVGMGSYQAFINTYFGNGEQRPNDYSFSMLQYIVDLPMALQVVPGIVDPATSTRPALLSCRWPFALDRLEVTSGVRPSATHARLELRDQQQAGANWSAGTVIIPSGHSKLWLAGPPLDGRLTYDIGLPTPEAQVGDVVGYIYQPRKPARGPETFAKQLREGADDIFEVALLNALARLGVPVLFAGQLRKEGQPPGTNGATAHASSAPQATPSGNRQKKASGPATPGFDLVALDHKERRAVVISVKGITRSPGDDDIEKLLKGVGIVEHLLHGWHVSGLIACHASATMLVRVRQREDVVVWGQDELETLLRADVRDHVVRMLWMPPGWPRFGLFGL